jgi:hypothetical protein
VIGTAVPICFAMLEPHDDDMVMWEMFRHEK